MNVITNGHARDVVEAYELPIELRDKEFDYLNWEAIEKGEDNASFIRYKDEWYDLQDFQTTRSITFHPTHPFRKWDGYISDTFFSGILIKWVPETNWEQVVVGRYYA